MNKTVDLICIEDTLEAVALRAALDNWGIEGRLHLIGKASDVVALLNGSYPLSQNIILLCHGDPQGIVLPELAEEIARQEPYDRFLSAQNLAEFLDLPDALVLNTGCITGTQVLADAFLQHGASAYIAPDDYPLMDVSLFLVLSFCYFYLVKELSLEEALQRARSADQDTAMYRRFHT